MKKVKLNSFKGLFALILLFGAVQTSIAQVPEITIIDKIVAQVGEEIILLSEIQAQRLQLLQEGMEGDKSTDCAILEEYMFEKLLVNQAKIDSIDVPDEMVNQEMEQRIRYIAGQIGSVEKLEEFYGKSVARIKADFFELIKKRMLAERMKQTITENVKVTPMEVERFFKALPKDSIPYINSKITVAQIVLYPKITDDDKALAKAKLESVREDVINRRVSFETAATIHSDDPGSRIAGGSLGWQTRGTMVPEFEGVVFKLKPGEISEVFETQYGYHFIKLIDRKGDNFLCSHILISPKVNDKAWLKASNSIDSIYNEIARGHITFEEAARRFSDDDGSKYNGGQIVNPYSGDYLWDIQNINEIDPQMSPIIESLKIGKYSSPSLYTNYYESKQGVRIVKLIAKTEPHIANLDTDRQLIEMAALNKKKQTVIDAWVNAKISGNFIQIDPEFIRDCTLKYNWLGQL